MNTLGTGFYANDQRDVCIKELQERAEVVWDAYRRAIDSARTPWSEDLRDLLVQRIRQEVERDIGYLEEMAQNVIVPYGHSFDLFLRDAWPGMLERIEVEIEFFGLKQQAIATPLGTQLSSPRYAGPASHWSRVQAALQEEPPDLLGAAREAIHTVEATAKVVIGPSSATLGDCIKQMRATRAIPPVLAKQLEALWGYASNLEGLRHGSASGQPPGSAELLYVVESSEAAVKLFLRLDRGVEGNTLESQAH